MLVTLLATTTLGAIQTTPVEGFKAIESRGSTDIQVVVDASSSKPYTVTVEGSEERMKLFRHEVSGGVLRLWQESKSGWSWYSSGGGELKVTVIVPTLERIRVTGSGDVEARGFAGEALDLDSTGSGDMTIEGKVGNLRVNKTGSGDVDISGINAEKVKVNAPGSGDIELEGQTARLDVNLMGSGDLEATRLVVSDEVDARIMGSGGIEVCAKGEVDKSTMGSGEVEVKCR